MGGGAHMAKIRPFLLFYPRMCGLIFAKLTKYGGVSRLHNKRFRLRRLAQLRDVMVTDCDTCWRKLTFVQVVLCTGIQQNCSEYRNADCWTYIDYDSSKSGKNFVQ